MTARAPASGVKRVAVIAHSATSLLRFRGALMRELAARRHRVLALAPDIAPETRRQLEGLGAGTATFTLDPALAAPLADRQTARELAAHFEAWHPQIVVSSGPKTAALGTDAGRGCGAERVMIVNGLSALGLGEAGATGWLAARSGNRRRAKSLRAADLVIFHNAQDRNRLIADGALAADAPHLIQPGSGVDLGHFALSPLPAIGEGLVFLMIARLARSTGVEVFAEAARLLKTKAQGARFLLVGPEGRGHGALTAAQVALYKDAIAYRGPAADVRPEIAAAHVVVYPSLGEGLPGALLEALSMGRPVITTSDPGCAQTVDERVNGCIVEPGNAPALAAAMETFLRRPDLIPAMARASRAKAERRFDERSVVASSLGALGLA